MAIDPAADPMTAALQEANRQADMANERASSGDTYKPSKRPSSSQGELATQPGQQKNSKPTPSSGQLPTQSTAPKRARDGQTFQQQSLLTQQSFKTQYGDQAEDQWIKQHEAELDKNRQIYGYDDPLPGAKPTAGAPAGTPDAPNRTIGAAAPPTTSQGSQAPNKAAPGSVPSANVVGLGGIGQTPAPVSIGTSTDPNGLSDSDLIEIRNTATGATSTLNYGQYKQQRRINPDFSAYVEIRPSGIPNAPWSKAAPKGTNETPLPGEVPSFAPNNPATPPTASGGAAAGAPDAPSALAGSGTGQTGTAAPATTASPAPTSPSSAAPSNQIAIQNKVSGTKFLVQASEYGPGKRWDSASFDQIPDPNNPTGVSALSDSSDSLNQTTKLSQTARAIPEMPDAAHPINSLVQMTGKPPEYTKNVLQGIGALLQGDPSGSWTEGYLNDTARMAWASQERQQGRNVDPMDTPEDYIDSWKDAFMGSDHSVPLVAELDQQMIDYAVDTSPANTPFNWKKAYGENGENGLISTQVASNDCGPNAFSTVLRSYGYNADPATALAYAQKYGYHNGDEFTGPNNMARMLHDEAGLDARAAPIDWKVIDSELDAGHVVELSSGGHYWTVAARRDGPNGTEYYAGATASVVGNPEWSTPGGLRYGGSPTIMITNGGQVNPNSRFVQELGLKPPVGSGPDRALLSQGTRERATQRMNMGMQQNAQQLAGPPAANADDPDESKVWKIAQEEGVDPIMAMAIRKQESGGSNSAESGAGARGQMQLTEAAANEVGVDRNDPDGNIRGGIRYYKKMLDRYNGNQDLALAAYNAGPGAVDQYGGVPPYGETQKYIPAVKSHYNAYVQRYAGVR